MNSTLRTRARLLGTTVLAGVGLLLASAPAIAQDSMETVTVTGYRASLTDSTNAKRASVGFSDAVFAEDIGKFPDTNIAESLNRIPGVTINRDNDGEGVNVSIRGLGTNFTKILLNGAQVSVATTGAIDASNNNREVDLNMFPTELFTQLTVSKTPQANQVEGGAAGTITMRSRRPFDDPGLHITYNLQGSQLSKADDPGARGALLFSDTEGPFGVLFGVTGVHTQQFTTGWEDGNAGWVTMNMGNGVVNNAATGNVNQVYSQCQGVTSKGASTGGGSAWQPQDSLGTYNGSANGSPCKSIGGGSMGIPNAIPANVSIPIPGQPAGTFYPVGTPVNAAMLHALNPAMAITTGSTTSTAAYCATYAACPSWEQGGYPSSGAGFVPVSAAGSTTYNVFNNVGLSNALIPRLGRSMYESGARDRANAVLSLEYRPSDDLHFYIDAIGGRQVNVMDRSDLDWGVRSGAGSQSMVPVGVTADANNVTTGGRFYNAQFFVEARPYQEKGDFFSVNPGMNWQVTELLHVDFQLNASRSHFFRDSPTFFLVSCPSAGNGTGVPGCAAPAGGVYADFANTGATPYPSITSNLDLNNPANYQWNNGRVNLQDEKRYTFTHGAHLDVSYGGDLFNVKVGAAFDDIGRTIVAIDDSQQWQNAICGDNPSVFIAPGSPTNNSQPGCNGLNVAGNAAAVNAALGGFAPSYPGYGTGQTAGWAPITYGGSLIPQSALANYLVGGPTGFITVDYNKAKTASNYWALDRAAIDAVTNGVKNGTATYPYSTASNSGGNSGGVEEKNYGLYAEFTGSLPVAERHLKYDVGLRWVETHQYVISPTQHNNPANTSLTDGGYYPATYTFATAKQVYQAFLPSVSLVYEVADDFNVRASVSRTMTRPNPTQMESVANFSDLTAQSLTLGNPDLKPFYSNNIDFGAELYTGGEGYIGVALFRKAISGFTVQQHQTQPFSYLSQFGITWSSLQTTQQTALTNRWGCNSDETCATAASITASQYVNVKGLLTVNGMEWDYVQPLDFLLEPYGLKGFGFNGNVTLLDQKSSGSVPAYATGVSPFQYNVTGYYENDGVMLRMSYNFNDKVYASGSNTQSVCLPAVTTSSAGCPGGAYLFGAPYGQADFSSSLKLSTLFGELPSDPEITFDISNVFHSKLRSYDQYTNAIHSYYDPGSLFLFGVRGTF